MTSRRAATRLYILALSLTAAAPLVGLAVFNAVRHRVLFPDPTALPPEVAVTPTVVGLAVSLVSVVAALAARTHHPGRPALATQAALLTAGGLLVVGLVIERTGPVPTLVHQPGETAWHRVGITTTNDRQLAHAPVIAVAGGGALRVTATDATGPLELDLGFFHLTRPTAAGSTPGNPAPFTRVSAPQLGLAPTPLPAPGCQVAESLDHGVTVREFPAFALRSTRQGDLLVECRDPTVHAPAINWVMAFRPVASPSHPWLHNGHLTWVHAAHRGALSLLGPAVVLGLLLVGWRARTPRKTAWRDGVLTPDGRVHLGAGLWVRPPEGTTPPPGPVHVALAVAGHGTAYRTDGVAVAQAIQPGSMVTETLRQEAWVAARCAVAVWLLAWASAAVAATSLYLL